MITATSRRQAPADLRAVTAPSGELPALPDIPAPYWVEPETLQTYPTSYAAYRRAREAEDKRPPRHRTLGPDVDHFLSRRWRTHVPEVEVRLTMRPDASPRIRRIVNEILRAIRKGQPASDAIRQVSRRFGLRHSRTRAFITASLGFELLARPDTSAPFAMGLSSLNSALAEWL